MRSDTTEEVQSLADAVIIYGPKLDLPQAITHIKDIIRRFKKSMEENTNTNLNEDLQQSQQQSPSSDYLIKSLTELKKNTVSKKEYEEQVNINKQLLSSMMDGSLNINNNDNDTKAKVDLEELRSNLEKKNQTNLDYIKNVLMIRKEMMESGARDPFLPTSPAYVPTDEDINQANKVAETLAQCIEESDGNAGMFNAAFNKYVAPRKTR